MSTMKELKSKVIEKAWAEPDFKKELLENPKEAIQKVTGIAIPENIDVTVLEEAENKLYFILPTGPEAVSDDAESPVTVW